VKEKLDNLVKNNKVTGIVLIIFGLIMLLWPNAAMKILCIVIGIILIALGGIRLLTYYNNKKTGLENRNELTLGLIMAVLGIILIVISRFFISVFFVLAGLAMLFICIRMFRQAYELRYEKGSSFAVSLIIGILVLALGIVMIINPVGTAAFLVQLGGIALIIAGLGITFSGKTRD